MEPVVLLAVVGVGLVVALAVWGFARERKRRDALTALAARHGWDYVDRDDRWCDAFDGLPFGTGHNRQGRHVMTGTHQLADPSAARPPVVEP